MGKPADHQISGVTCSEAPGANFASTKQVKMGCGLDAHVSPPDYPHPDLMCSQHSHIWGHPELAADHSLNTRRYTEQVHLPTEKCSQACTTCSAASLLCLVLRCPPWRDREIPSQYNLLPQQWVHKGLRLAGGNMLMLFP